MNTSPGTWRICLMSPGEEGVAPDHHARDGLAVADHELVFAMAGQVQHAPGARVQVVDDLAGLRVDRLADGLSRRERTARARLARRAGQVGEGGPPFRSGLPTTSTVFSKACSGSMRYSLLLSWRTMPLVTAGGRPWWLQRSSSSSQGKRAAASSSRITMALVGELC